MNYLNSKNKNDIVYFLIKNLQIVDILVMLDILT